MNSSVNLEKACSDSIQTNNYPLQKGIRRITVIFLYSKNPFLRKEAIYSVGNYETVESFDDLIELYIKDFKNREIRSTIEEVFKQNKSYTIDMIEEKIFFETDSNSKVKLKNLIKRIYQFKIKK